MTTQSVRSVLLARVRQEGWAELDFESEFIRVETSRGPHRVDRGAKNARAALLNVARALGLAGQVKTRIFRDSTGGIIVMARKEQADEVFEAYSEGFYS